MAVNRQAPTNTNKAKMIKAKIDRPRLAAKTTALPSKTLAQVTPIAKLQTMIHTAKLIFLRFINELPYFVIVFHFILTRYSAFSEIPLFHVKLKLSYLRRVTKDLI